ncbi:hypothetical protein FHX34_107270 [Actinoplanes teichomyceticus]|uniref:Uncharacterized protein n=1 Tax=Actinoplanes teichomyceticus TaxID=1867 RepID=A0A561VGS2_ACTTI|nr:hypothetical protein FHX34_107270 [Actinoplanes teichomyceticus]
MPSAGRAPSSAQAGQGECRIPVRTFVRRPRSPATGRRREVDLADRTRPRPAGAGDAAPPESISAGAPGGAPKSRDSTVARGPQHRHNGGAGLMTKEFPNETARPDEGDRETPEAPMEWNGRDSTGPRHRFRTDRRHRRQSADGRTPRRGAAQLHSVRRQAPGATPATAARRTRTDAERLVAPPRAGPPGTTARPRRASPARIAAPATSRHRARCARTAGDGVARSGTTTRVDAGRRREAGTRPGGRRAGRDAAGVVSINPDP